MFCVCVLAAVSLDSGDCCVGLVIPLEDVMSFVKEDISDSVVDLGFSVANGVD